MTLSRSIAIFALLAVIVLAWLKWRETSSPPPPQPASAPAIEKQAINFASHTFDPAAPPPDMPPLGPGESAECDSNFISNASVSGQSRRTDAMHATITVTQIAVVLKLNVNIWVPVGVTQHVADHEEGHRQISEYYYQDADKLAERIAATYMGKQVVVTGTDTNAASTQILQQMGAEITDEYSRELNPEPVQLRYDAITDHSLNDVVAADAVAQALRDTSVAAADPAVNPAN